MEDNYVYLNVKLYLKDGQTEDSIREIVQEMDYSFSHNQIVEHEVVDIADMQYFAPKDEMTDEESSEGQIDPFDMSHISIDGE